jgi:hypothetical protein
METLFVLIFILMNTVPADTKSFTLTTRLDTSFELFRQKDDWRVVLITPKGRSDFGTMSARGRSLLVRSAAGETSFDVYDRLGITAAPSWKSLEDIRIFGKRYRVERSPHGVEFIPSESGADRISSQWKQE